MCLDIFQGNILFNNIYYPCVKIFLIVQKSFYAAGFRGPVHIDPALCGQAGWIWIILQSRYYHLTSFVDSGCLSRFRILNLDTQQRIEKIIYVLLTQRLLPSSWNDVYAGSRIPDPDFFHPGSWIRDPGSRGQITLDPGYGSATLHSTVLFETFLSRLMFLHHFVTRIPYFVGIKLWEEGQRKEHNFIISHNWMRFSQMVGASDRQFKSHNSPGFDPSILRHSGIWGAADEAVQNKIHQKIKKKSPCLI